LPRLLTLTSVGAVLCGLLLSSCAGARRQIYPTELLKLNEAGTSSGSSHGTPVIVLTVKQLRSVDGTLFEVTGGTAVYITNQQREEFEFYPPIHVKIAGDALTISSANRRPMTFQQDDVRKVEVEWK
jgi:hypothetical protein